MAFRSMRFDGAQRVPGFDIRQTGGIWRTVLSIAAIMAMIVAIAGWYAVGSRHDYAGERDAQTLCLLHGATPRAELTLLDQTDALAAGSGQHFTRLANHIRDTLPRNGRLTIVPFGGDLGQPLEVAFDICSPGRGSEAEGLTEGTSKIQRDYEARFLAPLKSAEAQLTAPRESNQSPIAAQIMRAVNDPTIGWTGEQRVLNILTDGLENTTGSKVYLDGQVHLPPPPPELLRGVTVNYYELASAKHSALQTNAVRTAWKAWFEEAGAQVNMYAPGFGPS